VKLALSWLFAATLVACGTPEEGGIRGLNGGGSTPPAKTCQETTCDPNATCQDTSTGAVCACNPGFRGDGAHCDDIDECQDPALSGCSAQADCINRPGSFSCKCKDGFVGDGKTCTSVRFAGPRTSRPRRRLRRWPNPGFSCVRSRGSGRRTLVRRHRLIRRENLFLAPRHACVNTFRSFRARTEARIRRRRERACRGSANRQSRTPRYARPRGFCRIDGQRAIWRRLGQATPVTARRARAERVRRVRRAWGPTTRNTPPRPPTGLRLRAGFAGTAGSCADIDECAMNAGGCGAYGVCFNTDGGHLSAKPGYAVDTSGQGATSTSADRRRARATPTPFAPIRRRPPRIRAATVPVQKWLHR
jgi:hypothetical protein